MIKKLNAWRSRKYLDWVKTQPCIVSGLPADDPHHLVGHGFSGSGKAPDWTVIPLTRELHNELHHIGWRAWEVKYDSQLALLVKFWLYNFDEIRRFFNE